MPRTSPLRWLLLAVLLAAYCAAGFSRISFNVDILKLLPTHLRQVEGLSLFLKNFALSDELMITVEARDAEAADAAATGLAGHLRTRPDLARRVVDRPPWEADAPQLAELLAFALLNQTPEKIRELRARLAPEKIAATLRDSLEKLGESIAPREVAMLSYDPLGLTQPLDFDRIAPAGAQSEFTSADGTFRVLYVQAARPFANYKDNIAWLREIKRACAESSASRGVALGFTGEPAFVADISGTMDWDMTSSAFGTLLIIAVVFWLCYRRARPLFALQAMLLLVFTLSLATAGLFLNQLTVIGVGFASIMIGLSVDYGYFVWQKSRTHSGTVRELQWQCVQNVMWTAGTTAAAFFALNVSSLPGLSQLGNLVGIGVIFGAAIMLGVFAPLALRMRRETPAPSAVERFFASPRATASGMWLTLALVAALLIALCVKGPPPLNFSADSLRPRISGAYDALDRVYARLADDRDLLSLIVAGSSADEVLARLRAADLQLAAARARGEIRSATTALALWPDAAHQRENLDTLQPLTADPARLRQAVLDAGFKDEAFGLAESILKQWAAWHAAPFPVWPENDASRWILRRVAHRADGQFLALGLVRAVPGHEDALVSVITGPGVWLTSWKQLGRELQQVIPGEFLRVIAGLLGIVLLLLWIAFRRLRDVLLFAATTALVFAALAGAMSLLGMTWNLFNIAAILLLLGTGTDYSILLLLALQRNGGDVPAAQRSLGLVIFLCATSAAAGFGTVGWANHIGLASLGRTCALGLVIDALVSVFVLPHAWRWINRRAKNE